MTVRADNYAAELGELGKLQPLRVKAMAPAEPSSKMCPPRASTETGEDCSTSSRLYIFPRPPLPVDALNNCRNAYDCKNSLKHPEY